MATKILSILVLMVVVASAMPQYGHEHHHYEEDHYDPYPHYKFEYGVKDPHTKDYHSQKEEREGDKVKGYYDLVEPDGSKRTVHYEADHKTGFNAHVQREHNYHPEHKYEKKEYKY